MSCRFSSCLNSVRRKVTVLLDVIGGKSDGHGEEEGRDGIVSGTCCDGSWGEGAVGAVKLVSCGGEGEFRCDCCPVTWYGVGSCVSKSAKKELGWSAVIALDHVAHLRNRSWDPGCDWSLKYSWVIFWFRSGTASWNESNDISSSTSGSVAGFWLWKSLVVDCRVRCRVAV